LQRGRAEGRSTCRRQRQTNERPAADQFGVNVSRNRDSKSIIPRGWKAVFRDTLLLLREFKEPLIIFVIAIFAFGVMYYKLSIFYQVPVDSYAESFYLMLTLTFLQSAGEFPNQPLLQSFYFIMPLIGLATLALGLTEFGILLFNRRARTKEWEMAVASTYNKHTVLVGLGHLGYRVVQKLHEMEENVVVVEMNPNVDTLTAVRKMGVPVIEDDATRPSVLDAAKIAQAKTIVLCTQNDAMNLQVALKARSINKAINVVIRIFDEDFAKSLHDQFGFTALSATGMAAPVFAAAVAGADFTNPISVEGHQLSLARITISPNSEIAGKTVGFIEDNFHLNVVLLRHDHHNEMHPTDSSLLGGGDMIAALGEPEKLNRLLHENE
jgi:Trk K+ transport system NAD-binding subunit